MSIINLCSYRRQLQTKQLFPDKIDFYKNAKTSLNGNAQVIKRIAMKPLKRLNVKE